MKRYRLEVFDRNTLAFKCFAEATTPDIYIDVLVSSESTLTCKGAIDCKRGDFAQVRIDGKIYYQGIVSDVSLSGNTSEITLHQLIDVLNTQVFADVSLLNSQSIETWMTNLLRKTFGGSDTYERLPGLTITAGSSTSGTHAASDDGIYNLYELAVYFFKIYGVITAISFDFNSRAVQVQMRQVSSTVLHLDMTVSDVSEYEIENSQSADTPNKVIIRNQDNTAQEATYYWHPADFSGTIDTDATSNRVVPVITQCETVQLEEGQTFAAAAYARAEEILYATRYDDLIRVSIKAESKLINEWEIGQLFTLHDGETAYNTILTGIHTINMLYIELTFGYVRKRLTQILKMRRGK